MRLFISSFLVFSGLLLSPMTRAEEDNGYQSMTDNELNAKLGLCQVDTNVAPDSTTDTSSSSKPSARATSR